MRTSVKMQNKMSGLLMEVGATYSKKRLHGKKYFGELLERIEDVPSSVIELLKLSRSSYEMFDAIQRRLVSALRTNFLIRDRVERLMTIEGVGEITALTWVVEMGPPGRFSSLRNAISYCGLCSAQRESAGKEQRGPISKKRNNTYRQFLSKQPSLLLTGTHNWQLYMSGN